MFVNRGGSIRVHVCSLGNWGYRNNFKPFFFLTKNFKRKKHSPTRSTNQKRKTSEQKKNQGDIFCSQKLLGE